MFNGRRNDQGARCGEAAPCQYGLLAARGLLSYRLPAPIVSNRFLSRCDEVPVEPDRGVKIVVVGDRHLPGGFGQGDQPILHNVCLAANTAQTGFLFLLQGQVEIDFGLLLLANTA